MNTVAHPPRRDGPQPGPIGASPADEAQAAPFTSSGVTSGSTAPADGVTTKLATRLADRSVAPFPPRVSSSHSHARVTLAGKDTSLAGRPASFLSDDPCLSAQRAMGIC